MMDASATDRVQVIVDGRTAEVPRGTTVLQAARQMGVTIPTLCNYRGLSPYGACRVCLVEIETPRGRQMVASCSHPIENNLVVHTETENVTESRRTVLELLLAQAPDSRELAEFAAGLGVASTPFPPAAEGKCILCGLCARVCSEMMGRGAVSLYGRGTSREVRTAFDERTNQCQACGACAFVCPTGAVDLATITERRMQPHITNFDKYLSARPCIDLAHPQASPRVPVIDRENCIHFKTGECGLCSKVCQAGAIDYDQPEETVRLEVGAVVLTPGFEAFDATRRGEFGFGFAPNVLTNVQFERLLSASGPTLGHVLRPSDGQPPKRLAFIQCVGSRDTGCDNDYCSSVCCMAATKEAILAKEHAPGLDVTIFFLDLRAFGKDFDRYYERAQKQLGVRYLRSFISRTYEMPGTRNLRVVYASPEMKQIEEEFDMIVLSLGLEPSATLREQAERMQVVLNRWGFAQTSELQPLDTSRPGVFVGGAFQEPKDIPDTVMQASAAAARAMALLAPARGTRVRTKTYPPQRDITDEPPRVGVFICHCGSNIASVVDVERVVKRTRELAERDHRREQHLHVRRRHAEADQGADCGAPVEPRRRGLVHPADPRADFPRHAARRRPESLLAGNGQHPRPVFLGPLRTARKGDGQGGRPGSYGGGARGAVAAAGRGQRAGEQRVAGGRWRYCRHDGRPGPGRPGVPRPSCREDRRTRRHRPPASPHARRPGRAGVSRRDDRPGARPQTDQGLSQCPRGQGRRACRRFHLDAYDRTRPRQHPARGGRGGHRRHGAETANVRVRPKQPDPDATGTHRPPGTRRHRSAGKRHDRDDPVRGAAKRGAALLQPRLLHHRRKECVAPQGTISPGADHRPLSRHADVRFPRGGLSRGPRERDPVRPLRARAAAAAVRSTDACNCGCGSRRWDATCKFRRTWSCWPPP